MTTHDVVVQSTVKSNVKDKPDAITHIQRKPNVISDRIDEPNVISDIIDEPSVISDKIDEPNVISDIIDEPSVISDKIDEPNVISDIIDEPNVISDIIDEHSVISESLHQTEMESEIPHKQRVTSTLSYKPITDTVNIIIPINKSLDERLEEEVIRSLNTSLSSTEGSIIKNEYTTELSPLSLPPNHVSTDVRCPPENEQRTYSMKLNYRTWKRCIDTKQNDLSKEYTNTFADEFHSIQGYCPLVFKHNYFKTKRSRPGTPYLKVTARCKFVGCCTYTFNLKKCPHRRKRIRIKVHRRGDYNHAVEKVQKRQVRGLKRRVVAESLKTSTTLEYQSLKYATMQDDEKLAGNITNPQTQIVLRKIKSEQQKQGNLCTDVFQEVKILLETYRGLIDGGFIQIYSYSPFKVITYRCFESIDNTKCNYLLEGVSPPHYHTPYSIRVPGVRNMYRVGRVGL